MLWIVDVLWLQDVSGYYMIMVVALVMTPTEMLWVVNVLWLQDELDRDVYLTSLYCTTMDFS